MTAAATSPAPLEVALPPRALSGVAGHSSLKSGPIFFLAASR